MAKSFLMIRSMMRPTLILSSISSHMILAMVKVMVMFNVLLLLLVMTENKGMLSEAKELSVI